MPSFLLGLKRTKRHLAKKGAYEKNASNNPQPFYSFQVTAVLVQEAVYIVNPASKEEARKKERLVMAEAHDDEDADVGENQDYHLSLNIDQKMALTDYPWCDFIHMGYFVHVIARTHGFYDDVVVKLPVIIEPNEVTKIDTLAKPQNTKVFSPF